MDSDFTFLIPHAGAPFMLDACLDSIRKYHDELIVVSQHEGDNFDQNIEWMAAKHGADYIYHRGWFGDACFSLFQACSTKYAIYIESDCLLLDDLYPLMDLVKIHDFMGVEEVIKLKPGLDIFGLGPENAYLRYAPNYYTHSFFLINMERFKKQAGAEGVWVDSELAASEFGGLNPIEPSHGISQVVRTWPKLDIACRFTDYGAGTVYGTPVFHMWFGGWRIRDTQPMGFKKIWMKEVELRVLNDYWTGQFAP